MVFYALGLLDLSSFHYRCQIQPSPLEDAFHVCWDNYTDNVLPFLQCAAGQSHPEPHWLASRLQDLHRLLRSINPQLGRRRLLLAGHGVPQEPQIGPGPGEPRPHLYPGLKDKKGDRPQTWLALIYV